MTSSSSRSKQPFAPVAAWMVRSFGERQGGSVPLQEGSPAPRNPWSAPVGWEGGHLLGQRCCGSVLRDAEARARSKRALWRPRARRDVPSLPGSEHYNPERLHSAIGYLPRSTTSFATLGRASQLRNCNYQANEGKARGGSQGVISVSTASRSPH